VQPAHDVQFGDSKGQSFTRFGNDLLDAQFESIGIPFLAGKRTELAA